MGDQSEHTAPHTPSEPVAPKGTGFSRSLIIGIVLAVVVIILAAQNTGRVRFNFLWWHAWSPLVVIILATALAGIVLDEIGGLVWRRRRRRAAGGTAGPRGRLRRTPRAPRTSAP